MWLPREKYICLWKLPDGRYVANDEGEFLCAEAWRPHDPEVETKMRQAARSLGIDGGEPVWMTGRKVTKMEHEVQMERLLDGLIPDEIEAMKIAIERKRAEQ